MIIGISGKYQSGKDALADAIIQLEPSFSKTSFAAKLKDCASIILGVSVSDLNAQEGKAVYMPAWGMTRGEFLQQFGTDCCRRWRNDIWVTAALSMSNTMDVIFSDARFPNEIMAVQKRGGITVRVNRAVRDLGGRDPLHPSETSLDDWPDFDLVYDNNGTLEDLRDFARQVVNCMYHRSVEDFVDKATSVGQV